MEYFWETDSSNKEFFDKDKLWIEKISEFWKIENKMVWSWMKFQIKNYKCNEKKIQDDPKGEKKLNHREFSSISEYMVHNMFN